MKNWILCLMLGLSLMTVHGFPAQQRRQAFDPNLLMDRYMNVRTNQETFGSYHPNDIKEDINRFFQDGGDQKNSAAHWGLMIYNPNAAMPQYMGHLQEPGNLVPGLKTTEETDQHSNHNAKVSVPAVGFNPNELNRHLMQSVQAPVYFNLNSPDGIKEHAADFGFNPDAVNKELMSSVLNHAEQSKHESSGNNSWSTSTSSESIVGKKQNDNMAQGSIGSQHIGYNADQVNAGLYSSMSYNPNTVNAATFNMPSFDASAQLMTGGITTVNSGSGDNTNTSPGAGGPDNNGGSQVQNVAGGHNQLSQTNTGNIKTAGAGIAGAVHASGIGGTGSYNPFKVSGAGSSSHGQNDVINIVPSTRISQNGLPPGIPAGMTLTQAEASKPTADGIGGLGI